MKGKRYSTEEKVRILREVDGGKSIVEASREKNISDVTFHRWRQQFGHMNLNEARRLKELERENTELKKMLAEAMLAKRSWSTRSKKIVSPAHKKQVVTAAVQAGVSPCGDSRAHRRNSRNFKSPSSRQRSSFCLASAMERRLRSSGTRRGVCRWSFR